METIKKELKELFEPTARCFKGIGILFLIYAAAVLIISIFVPYIIWANLDKSVIIDGSP